MKSLFLNSVCFRILAVFFLIVSTGTGVCCARDWYVRPEGGKYGPADGTSFDRAWSGLGAVVWGQGGVKAGDTLWVCGTHVYASKIMEAYRNIFSVRASGTSDNWITVRGDCGRDPGVIWGAYKDLRPGGIHPGNWKEVQPGIFYNRTKDWNKIFVKSGLFENIRGDRYDRYSEADSLDALRKDDSPGRYCVVQKKNNSAEIWLRPFNPKTFRENIYFSGVLGHDFTLDGKQKFIKFKGITFIATLIGQLDQKDSHEHYSFEDCRFISHTWSWPMFFGPYRSSHISFDRCEIAHAPNGIYLITARGNHSHYRIRNCFFHDIGKSVDNKPVHDGHAIGIQKAQYIFIEGNRFEHCGSAVDLHMGMSSTPQSHIYMLRNHVSGMRKALGRCACGSGFYIEGNNSVPKGNSDHIVIAYNILEDCEGYGIFSIRKDTVDIFNNTVVGCGISFTLMGHHEYGASARFINNVSLNPKKRHFKFVQREKGMKYYFEAGHNLYFGGPRKGFCYQVPKIGNCPNADYMIWKSRQFMAYRFKVNEAPVATEKNSLNRNPGFMRDENRAYYPGESSPLVDAGKDVGYDKDFSGTQVPQGKAPDIGAREFVR